jgi:hypothetical protein
MFNEKDLSRDVEEEIQELLAELRNLDEQQAQAQIYSRVAFRLCGSCHAAWIADPTGSGSTGREAWIPE